VGTLGSRGRKKKSRGDGERLEALAWMVLGIESERLMVAANFLPITVLYVVLLPLYSINGT
jgi:hypothetical protein